MTPVLTGRFAVLGQKDTPFGAVDNFVGDDVEDHIVFFSFIPRMIYGGWRTGWECCIECG